MNTYIQAKLVAHFCNFCNKYLLKNIRMALLIIRMKPTIYVQFYSNLTTLLFSMVLPCLTGFPPGIQLGRIPNETNSILLKFNNFQWCSHAQLDSLRASSWAEFRMKPTAWAVGFCLYAYPNLKRFVLLGCAYKQKPHH